MTYRVYEYNWKWEEGSYLGVKQSLSPTLSAVVWTVNEEADMNIE